MFTRLILFNYGTLTRRSNQSILKISPGCSLEGLMLKLKTPVLWPPYVKSWLIGKDSDAGSDWGQEEEGTTEDEMAGWHHQLNGREFEWTPGVGDGQEAWHAAIHGVTKSQTWLSDWTELRKDLSFISLCPLEQDNTFVTHIWTMLGWTTLFRHCPVQGKKTMES